MGQLWGDFIGLERLNDVIAQDAICFLKTLFCAVHFISGLGYTCTIYCTFKEPFFGFFWIGGIGDFIV